MAITINQNPEKFTPAYNDITFVVTSTNVAQANFKYIADVVVGGVTRRLKLAPDPTYSCAAFNIGRVIESYVTSDIDKSTYGFQQNTNSYISYTVQFGEEYGASSGTTIYPALTTSATKFAYNGEVDFLTLQNYVSADRVLNQSTVSGLLTHKPATVNIRDSEDTWLHTISDTSGTIYYAEVITYDSSNNIIQTVKVENIYQSVAFNDYRFVRFGCGTNNLNLISSARIKLGALPIITASVAKYQVTFQTFSGVAVSAPQIYVIDNTCTKNTVYRFHFLNELGGFDSFSFIRGSNKKVAIKRDKYKKVVGGLTSSTTYGYSKSDRADQQYNTSLKDNIKVKSDWINEDAYTWLEELITSPEVYLDDPTHGLVAVTVVNSSYDFKQTAQDKIFNLEIEFEYSFNRYRQRR